MMFQPDIMIEFEFDMKEDKVQVRTNAKQDKVSDLLGEYLHAQVGAGNDTAQPNNLEVYKIAIGVDLNDDSWGSRHDCGNKSLRDGILIRVLQMLDKEPERVTYVD